MLQILKDQRQIEQARQKLRAMNCDSSRGWWRMRFAMLYALRFRRLAPDVAVNKSWDVLTMAEQIEKNHPQRDTRILDMGSFNCEIPLVLWKRGYRNIYAVDFNPLGRSIRWYGNQIHFQCENFYQPTISPGSLDVITSLSTIEHGYDRKNLFPVAKRLLKAGGSVMMTTDYHDPKIPIDPEYRLFNLTYRIFCRSEIEEILADAKEHGFEAIGEFQWQDSDYPIEFLGNQMTFIFLGFRKKVSQ